MVKEWAHHNSNRDNNGAGTAMYPSIVKMPSRIARKRGPRTGISNKDALKRSRDPENE